MNFGAIMIGKSSEAPVRVWKIIDTIHQQPTEAQKENKEEEEEEIKDGEEKEKIENEEEIIVSHSIDIQDSEDMVTADWVKGTEEEGEEKDDSLVLKGGNFSLRILRISSKRLNDLWSEYEEDPSKKNERISVPLFEFSIPPSSSLNRSKRFFVNVFLIPFSIILTFFRAPIGGISSVFSLRNGLVSAVLTSDDRVVYFCWNYSPIDSTNSASAGISLKDMSVEESLSIPSHEVLI